MLQTEFTMSSGCRFFALKFWCFFCCRVLASCRVPDSFDARFSCLYRCYQLLGLAGGLMWVTVEDGGELAGEQPASQLQHPLKILGQICKDVSLSTHVHVYMDVCLHIYIFINIFVYILPKCQKDNVRCDQGMQLQRCFCSSYVQVKHRKRIYANTFPAMECPRQVKENLLCGKHM